MKKTILSVMLFLSVCSWALAESSVWKVQKGKSVMYLGATIHILREADYPLPPEFDKAYKASEIIVFETDMGKLQDPTTQQKVLTQAVYADGSTVDKHLSAEAYAALSAYCASNGLPLEALKHFKPAMLITTLEVMEFMKMGVGQKGVDSFFCELANKDNKTVAGLETVDEQIGFMLSMADGNEDQFVTYSLTEMKEIKEQFESLANAWRKGDAEKLNELMDSEIQEKMPKLYKKLITDRNSKWLPEIETYLGTPQTEFILVGAGHLVGPDGLIAALQKMGYAVEKL